DRQADDGEGPARPLPYQAGGERPVEVAPPAVVGGERTAVGVAEEAILLSGHGHPETRDRRQAPEFLLVRGGHLRDPGERLGGEDAVVHVADLWEPVGGRLPSTALDHDLTRLVHRRPPPWPPEP